MQTQAALLVQRLRERIHDCSTVGKIDISRWFKLCTFDIIGNLAFGEPFGCLQKGEYHPWVALLFAFARDATYYSSIQQFPWLSYVVQRNLPATLRQKLDDHQKR